MTSFWQMLAGNLAVVALFVLGWGHARYWLRAVRGPIRSALFGLTMGVGAVSSMLMAAEVRPGLFLDLRFSLVAVSAFLGGPVAAAVATALSSGWRLGLGGSGVVPGLLLMVATAGAGLGLRVLTARWKTDLTQVVALALCVTLLVLLLTVAVPVDAMLSALAVYIYPTAALNFAATILAGLVVLHARRRAAERDLLVAALDQSPNFFYVKDHHSRFVAVNQRVVDFNSYPSAKAMIGKTDFELTTPERAQELYETEQAILRSGKGQYGIEEHIPDKDGTMRWFSTSKVPLYSPSCELIGLAGVTYDVTEDKQLRQELIDSRNMLSFALAEMSDGLAMFDGEGRLEFCNEQYRECFPYTGKLRQPGAHMREILEEVIKSGEQVIEPTTTPAEWIERILANLNRESEEIISLFDGRWLQVRTRPTSESKTLVVVTDVTRLKQAELALHSATDKLNELVNTDALTGLLNRRAFDSAMDTEIGRSGRAGSPMSLLLIDVDRFKAYNDQYGHVSGDECLKLVARHLQRSLKRSADLAVRYGGEEFAAILPETDEDGAYLVAEAFRKSLADARIPHEGSERGILTASVGVATYMPDNFHRSASELIQAADEALYSAKAAGRDRVFGTRVKAKQARYAHE